MNDHHLTHDPEGTVNAAEAGLVSSLADSGSVSSVADTGAEVYWRDALDVLEAHLRVADAAAEGHDVGQVAAWEAPVGAPPIPASMMARAQHVLARQRELTSQLPQMVAGVGQQIRVSGHFSTAGRQGSVYLDVTA